MRDPEKNRANLRRHYKKYKDKYLERNRRFQKIKRIFIRIIKTITPCTDCKKHYPHYVMDFDHLHNKKLAVSHMTSYPWNQLVAEIAKCEVVCANCHRVRTHNRRCIPMAEEPVLEAGQ